MPLKYFWFLLLGLVIGAWLLFSPGTLVVVVFTAVIFYILNLNLKDSPNRKMVITICIVAICLRFIFAIANYYFSYLSGLGADFIGDARAYSGSGQYIAEVATHKPMPNIDGNEPAWAVTLRNIYKGTIPLLGYRVDSFAKYIGLIYSVFGYAPITVKFLNSLLSVVAGILLFFMAKDMFSARVANITLALALFWPSIFLWSVTATKDSLTIFLIIMILYVFCRIRKHINILEYSLVLAILITHNFLMNLLFFTGIIFIMGFKAFIFKRKIKLDIFIPLLLILTMKISAEALSLIRLHIFVPLLIAFTLSFISFLDKRKLIALIIIMFCLGLFFPFYAPGYKAHIESSFTAFEQQGISTHKSQLIEASSGYKIYPERYYDTENNKNPGQISFSELLTSYGKGIVYALFSPFPWSISGKFAPVISFQTILYYMLLPFIFLGLLVAVRYRWRDFLSVLIFVFLVTSMYALYEGNMGTVFRHRDILTIFFLVFAALGLGKILGLVDVDLMMKKAGRAC